MREWFNDFWNTKAGAARTIKGALVLIAGAMACGLFGELPQNQIGAMMPWITAALGVALPAGENNSKPE